MLLTLENASARENDIVPSSARNKSEQSVEPHLCYLVVRAFEALLLSVVNITTIELTTEEFICNESDLGKHYVLGWIPNLTAHMYCI